ncbi:MAG: hypothetical protein J5777_08350 [Clostridiales bacterium]|nr:hypothetical protein [Clostridiales bacterium]
MRFREDVKAYYFTTSPSSSRDELSDIYQQEKEYLKEYAGSMFGPEDTTADTVKKYVPLVMFLAAVVLLIVFSMKRMVGGILFTFGGVFVLIGILFLLPGKKTAPVELPNQGKMPKGLMAAFCILIGLAVIVPAFIAPSFGYGKSFALSGGAWFVLGGLFFISYTIVGLIRHITAFKNPVTGKCIGYIKMISGGTNDNQYHYQRVFVTGTPVFEYSIGGTTYQAFQEDNMRTGMLTPAVGETVELGVLPGDPYAVYYHKNTAAKIFCVALALVAIGAGIFILCNLPKINDNNGFSVNTMGGQVKIAKAKFDDKTIAKYLSTDDYTIEYLTIKSVYQVDGVPVMELSNGRKFRISDKEKDKYYEGRELYLISPNDGSTGVNFIADDWEYAGTREVKGLPAKTQ